MRFPVVRAFNFEPRSVTSRLLPLWFLLAYAEARETRFHRIASRNPRNVSNVTLYIIPRRFIECGTEVGLARPIGGRFGEKSIIHFYTLRINKCFINLAEDFLRFRGSYIVGVLRKEWLYVRIL